VTTAAPPLPRPVLRERVGMRAPHEPQPAPIRPGRPSIASRFRTAPRTSSPPL
jgi:hypothetical protein